MPNNTFIIPKYRVFHVIPWNSDKNIGKSYNETMSLVRDKDWVCFLDGDAVHTSSFFGSNIESVINNNPSYSLFTCYTNRVNSKWQLAPNVDWKNNDQSYHREIGQKLWLENNTNVINVTNLPPLSGVLILIKKEAWSIVGGFKEDKMLAIDNDIHIKFKNSKLNIGLMKGIYVQHWYRGGDINNKQHLL
jgi:hypothetical protein